MAISTITGLGSGLEINKLVEALANAEKAPKQTQINIQKARNETQLSAVGMLKSAVEAFESSLLGLKSKTSSFAGYQATSSQDSVASVGFRSVPATASKVATKPLAEDITDFGGGGSLEIKVGTQKHNVAVAAGATIVQVRDAINSQLSGKGIVASVERDADGTRLVLASSQTGAGKDIVVTASGDPALSELNVNGAISKTSTGAGFVTRAADAVQAGAGSHVLKVDELATASKVVSALQSDTQYAAGELKIKLGATGVETTINVPENASLGQIRDTINSQMSSKGISASIISDSNGARLMLSSEMTGAGNDIYVTGTDGVAGLTIDPSGADRQSGDGAGWLAKASDAEFTIDGLKMTSKDNTVNGLQGLSIKLLEKGTTTLSVSANSDGIAGSVESFVMAYNTLLTVTNGLTRVTQTTDADGNATTKAGALVADSTLRSMMSQLRTALSNPVSGAGDLKVLAQLGVKTNRTTGMLELDSDMLKKAVAEHPEGIEEFFTGKEGMFKRIGDITSVYSGKSGLLASREASITKAVESLAVDEAKLERRIENLTLSLFKKFNAMDSLVARLNATSQSVLATLNALNKKGSDD